ncbi:MAG: Gfo/Idh/MocA family oxidoreductase, partial [Nitrospinae bacterium]|nr:Gfo/Idh/MocA family oxidoreductase [Nitrospinota bacterium]
RAGGVQATDDWQKVVRADNVDAVVIATTHDHLAPIALAAARAGKHFLIEKPAARSVGELKPVMQAVQETGVIVKVGFNHRFHPAFIQAREIFGSGALGPMMFIRGRYGHGGRPGYEKEWRADREISGGGELVDQGMHLIDLSRWFLGDFERCDGFMPTYFWDMKVEDNAFMALQTEAGQMAWLHATWTEWKNMFSFEIYGKDAKLHIEGLGGSYGVEQLTYYKMLPEMGPPEISHWEYPLPDRSWDLEFQEFEKAIHEKRQPSGNLEDALAALEVLDHLYQQVKP